MFAPDLKDAAQHLVDDLRQRNLKLVTAESCTGGTIAGVITEIAGASDVFDRGYVTYSNAAKSTELTVDAKLIAENGAVSLVVGEAMALGALTASGADVSVSVTGIAGPGGGTPDKPVGLVYIAAAKTDGSVISERKTFGDIGRSNVRLATIKSAIALVQTLLQA
ncbi:MAG: CinA family protein [Hyphomicrobiaceae bacterium]